jgi:hypothetical protein
LKLIMLAMAAVRNPGISGGHSFEAMDRGLLYPHIMEDLRNAAGSIGTAKITVG